MNHIDYRGRDSMPACGCKMPASEMRRDSSAEDTGHHVPGADCCKKALAMAYVRMQSLDALYDPCTALIAGTVFPDLDKPFCGEVISASAYPSPPARTCGCMRGGVGHD